VRRHASINNLNEYILIFNEVLVHIKKALLNDMMRVLSWKPWIQTLICTANTDGDFTND
jgi:hypothetical protein